MSEPTVVGECGTCCRPPLCNEQVPLLAPHEEQKTMRVTFDINDDCERFRLDYEYLWNLNDDDDIDWERAEIWDVADICEWGTPRGRPFMLPSIHPPVGYKLAWFRGGWEYEHDEEGNSVLDDNGQPTIIIPPDGCRMQVPINVSFPSRDHSPDIEFAYCAFCYPQVFVGLACGWGHTYIPWEFDQQDVDPVEFPRGKPTPPDGYQEVTYTVFQWTHHWAESIERTMQWGLHCVIEYINWQIPNSWYPPLPSHDWELSAIARDFRDYGDSYGFYSGATYGPLGWLRPEPNQLGPIYWPPSDMFLPMDAVRIDENGLVSFEKILHCCTRQVGHYDDNPPLPSNRCYVGIEI